MQEMKLHPTWEMLLSGHTEILSGGLPLRSCSGSFILFALLSPSELIALQLHVLSIQTFVCSLLDIFYTQCLQAFSSQNLDV